MEKSGRWWDAGWGEAFDPTLRWSLIVYNQSMERRSVLQSLSETLVRYGLFLAFSAASLWLMLQFRNAILLLGIYLQLWPNDIWLMDVSSLVVLIGLFLVCVGFMDHYFLEKRTAAQGGTVMPVLIDRAKKVALYQVVTALFAVGAGWLIQYLTLHR